MCLSPIPFKRLGRKIKFLQSVDIENGALYDGVIPCKKCVECQMQYSGDWALRCVQEMKYHKVSCFITLTYDDVHNPVEVKKRDLQLFVKRLRKYLEPHKIRFFACGEYGGKTLRPHYHLIIFGWCPNDLIDLKYTEKGSKIYTSMILFKLWQEYGFVSVGLSYDTSTIKYMCKYLQKSLDVSVLGLAPAFTLMSRKPMLGLREKDIDSFSDFEYEKGRKRRPEAYKRKIPPFLKRMFKNRAISYDELERKKNIAKKLTKNIDN